MNSLHLGRPEQPVAELTHICDANPTRTIEAARLTNGLQGEIDPDLPQLR